MITYSRERTESALAAGSGKLARFLLILVVVYLSTAPFSHLGYAASESQRQTETGSSAATHPCAGEIQRFCGNIAQGGGRIVDCLRDNKEDLSPACLQKVRQVEDARKSKAEADRDAWDEWCRHVPTIQDCQQLKDAWGQVLFLSAAGMTVAAMGPYLGAALIVKMLGVGWALDQAYITPEELKNLEEARLRCEDRKRVLDSTRDHIDELNENIKSQEECMARNKDAVAGISGRLAAETAEETKPKDISGLAVECSPAVIAADGISICTAKITFADNDVRYVTNTVAWEYEPDYQPFVKDGIIRGAEVGKFVKEQKEAVLERKIQVRARYAPKPQEKWAKAEPAKGTVTVKFQADQEKAAVGLSITPDRSSVYKGESVVYAYRVENTGDQPLSNVNVKDDTCSRIKITSGGVLLQPGQGWDFVCPSDPLESTITNNATVTAYDPSGKMVSNSAKAVVTIVPRIVDVPDVVTMTFGSAKESIVSVRLAVGEVIDEKSDVAAGLVIGQSPEAGVRVEEGSRVNLRVSRNEPRSVYLDPPRVSKKVKETVTFTATLIYKDGKQEIIEPPRLATWDPGPSNSFTCEKPGKYLVWAHYKGASGSATATCEDDWSVPAFEPPISSARDRDARVTQAGPGDYTWYAFCAPRTGEVTYGQHLLTGRKMMSGPFPGPRTAYDWIVKNCPTWRCDQNGACALTPAMGGQWKVLCGKNDLRIVLGKTHDPMKHMLIKEGFLGEPDARAWANRAYPSWTCLADGRPPEVYPRTAAPRRGGNWAVVCSRQHGGVGLTQHPDLVTQWIWSEGFFGEPDARAWTDQNCPSWRCDAQGKCLTGIARRSPGDRPLEVPPEPGSGSGSDWWSSFAEGFSRGAQEGANEAARRVDSPQVQKPLPQPGKPSTAGTLPPSGPRTGDAGVNCEALRAGYHKKCLEMRESYAKQNCAQNRNYSGCFLDPVGCAGYVVTDALPDGRSQGRVGCGRSVVEQYISCLTACNQGLLQKRYNMNTVPTCGNECKTKALDAIKGCNTGSR